MIVARTPGFVRLRLGRRTVTLPGVTAPDGPSGPDFVVDLDAIERWDPPHEAEPLELDDVCRITELAENAFAAEGESVEFE